VVFGQTAWQSPPNSILDEKLEMAGRVLDLVLQDGLCVRV
jgi:hypothetical protein